VGETQKEKTGRVRLTKQAVTATLRERMRNRRIARALAFFMLVVLAFVGGFAVRSQVAFVASLGFPVEEGQATASQANKPLKTSYNSLTARLEEVEDLLTSNSMDDLDLGRATPVVMKALMESLDDPYAAYFDAERYAAYVKEATERSYTGIGVLFSEHDGRVYAADVFEGSEAESLGVAQGDFIEAIDGTSTEGWTSSEVINDLAREEGSQVVVSWMHPSSPDAQKGSSFTTTLTSHAFELPNVSTSLDDGVGYVRLRQISQNSSDLVKDAVSSLTAEGATAFVLDIRDNPGGYLTQAVDIACLFVQSGVIVEVETADGTTPKSATGTTITNAPLVVLANDYTSAAAEVLAAGLQGNQRATVVGQTTRGKGSVQVTRELTFGGGVRYTAAYYLTPLGASIDGVGVVPNVSLVSSDDSDMQLEVAVDTARSLAAR
jgi:carboxyl-terminal processing protease